MRAGDERHADDLLAPSATRAIREAFSLLAIFATSDRQKVDQSRALNRDYRAGKYLSAHARVRIIPPRWSSNELASIEYRDSSMFHSFVRATCHDNYHYHSDGSSSDAMCGAIALPTGRNETRARARALFAKYSVR